MKLIKTTRGAEYIITANDYREVSVDVRVYEVSGRARVDGVLGPPLMMKKGGVRFPDDSTENPDEAEVFVAATIKWDGCVHWDFGEEGYIHTCSGPSAADDMAEVMRAMFEAARPLLKRVDWPE